MIYVTYQAFNKEEEPNGKPVTKSFKNKMEKLQWEADHEGHPFLTYKVIGILDPKGNQFDDPL